MPLRWEGLLPESLENIKDLFCPAYGYMHADTVQTQLDTMRYSQAAAEADQSHPIDESVVVLAAGDATTAAERASWRRATRVFLLPVVGSSMSDSLSFSNACRDIHISVHEHDDNRSHQQCLLQALCISVLEICNWQL